MNDVIEHYLACWNATDLAQRRALITKTWTPEASYVDPLVSVEGHDAIEAAIAAAQQQFPGFVFSLVGPIDTHHRHARFGWGLGPEGGEPVVVGFDVATADADGRLSQVIGFLDKVPG